MRLSNAFYLLERNPSFAVLRLRQILQRWRRALHVPLRVDLFCQSPAPTHDCCDDGTQQSEQPRLLLERWCLEYVPTTATRHQLSSSSDPIVQLRQVCKLIVIWLRNLYCSSRLLPSQKIKKRFGTCSGSEGKNCVPQVRFSIYVLPSFGEQDFAVMMKNQRGFQCLKQPSGVVTPYGDLSWKVYYSQRALSELLHKLRGSPRTSSIVSSSFSEIEENVCRERNGPPNEYDGDTKPHTALAANVTTSKSMAILKQVNTCTTNQWDKNYQPRGCGVEMTPADEMPQSAPTTGNFLPLSNRCEVDTAPNNATNPLVYHDHKICSTYHDSRDHVSLDRRKLKCVAGRAADLGLSFFNGENHEGWSKDMQSHLSYHQHEHYQQNEHLLQRRNTSIGIGKEEHGALAIEGNRARCSELRPLNQQYPPRCDQLQQPQPEHTMSGTLKGRLL